MGRFGENVCRLVVIAFATLYFIALVVMVLGIAGIAGQEQDPLSGVFVLLLGLPWSRMIEVMPEPAWPWLLAMCPAINLGLLILACKLLTRARGLGQSRRQQ